ncbi:MAG TPA: NAD(P)/FAD-dependent oxidoreductase, partial [Chlamydiales bacterium]|nr:NAD(P)/FAD-dependent oxidoreductase [Chlamydiales bacterium]
MMYDVAVIGSGPGGYVAAIRAGQLGLKTVCIEKMKELGGTCLNVGCIPSKALLHSTEMLFRLQKDGPRNGLHFSGNVDFSNMQKRKEEIVQGFNKGVEFLFRKNKVERVQGTAQLIDPNTILVGNQKISAKNIILATGSEPISLSFLPIDEKRVVSSTGALSLPSIPKRLLIIGAGVIGVELGSVYNRLGSEVQFIEFMDRVCPSMDSTISQTLEKILSKQGMKFFLSHKVTSAKLEKKEIILSIEGKEKFTLAGDVVLVSIGRKPYSKDLGLEKLGIEKDLKGFVQVDGFFRTIVPSIYAIGDLIDGPMLAHKAMEEGVAVA